jgi:hypothetical protein
MDVLLDATADGRRLKFLNVIDEHSHFYLAIRLIGAASSRTWWMCSSGHHSCSEPAPR